jgi:hypothetical protein
MQSIYFRPILTKNRIYRQIFVKKTYNYQFFTHPPGIRIVPYVRVGGLADSVTP